MDLRTAYQHAVTRRTFFGRSASGIGAAALATLLAQESASAKADDSRGALHAFHHRPRAKRVIYMFQAGAPSHLDLFDNKPTLAEWSGKKPNRAIEAPR